MKKTKDGFRDQNAREEIATGRGCNEKSRVNCGAIAESPTSPAHGQQHQQQHRQRNRQVRGEFIRAKEEVAQRNCPVHQRSFFQIAVAIDFQRHEVVRDVHFARGLRVS